MIVLEFSAYFFLSSRPLRFVIIIVMVKLSNVELCLILAIYVQVKS